MKKILITGVNSYVGNSFAKWVEQFPINYKISKVSLRDGSWRGIDLSIYDTILHVAGIAHVSTDPKMEELYYKINRDLTFEIAKKAKKAGIKQFIYMSSIIVYGSGDKSKRIINKNTNPNPDNFYGQSKLEAEKKLLSIQNNTFNVVIIRPPMIYGKNSKGNYPKLAKIAKKTPIFPDIHNERSMLHIDNLSEFIRLIIKNNDKGLFFPQNKEYVCTSELVNKISEIHNKKIFLINLFNPFIKPLINKINIINKVFGNLTYDQKMSEYKEEYRVNNLYESIVSTELE